MIFDFLGSSRVPLEAPGEVTGGGQHLPQNHRQILIPNRLGPLPLLTTVSSDIRAPTQDFRPVDEFMNLVLLDTNQL